MKTSAISVRVHPDLKAELDAQAKGEGRTLAGYVERILVLHLQPPAWKMRDPQAWHSHTGGPKVALPIAEGWPVCSLSPDRAEDLAQQLLHAARVAREMPPAE